MSRWFRLIVRQCGVVSSFVLALSGVGFGQAPAAEPQPSASGVFGGTSSRSGGLTSGLVLTLTEAYDQNILAEGGAPQAPLEAGGLFTDLTANLNSRLQRRRLQLSMAAGTDVRYYQNQHTAVGVGHYGSSGLTYGWERTVLSVDGSVAYAPSYLYRLFASVVAAQPVGEAVASGYAVTDTPSYNYGLRVNLTQNITQRNRITLHGGGRFADFLHESAQLNSFGARDLTSYESGLDFTRGLSRNLNLNLGYAYRRAQYFTGVFPTEHDVTIGLDYNHPLSKTRRSHIHVGASTVTLDAAAPGDPSGELRRQYRAIGDVSMSRQFGRSWMTSGTYRRGVGYIEGFDAPVLTDGLSVNVSGLLSRRVDFLAGASYSVGEPVIAAGLSSGFTTYAGNARIRFALNEKWALSGEYLYYFYDFGSGFVPVGVPPRMTRNSVRGGLTLWVPLGAR